MLMPVADQEVFVPVQVHVHENRHHDQSEAASPLNGAISAYVPSPRFQKSVFRGIFRAVLDLANDRKRRFNRTQLLHPRRVGASEHFHHEKSSWPVPVHVREIHTHARVSFDAAAPVAARRENGPVPSFNQTGRESRNRCTRKCRERRRRSGPSSAPSAQSPTARPGAAGRPRHGTSRPSRKPP